MSFDIVITNQGDIAADNIEIADFIPTGMTFNPALNADWTETGGVATTTLTVADGDLAAGGLQPTQSATVTIVLTLAAPQTAGMSLRNVAEIRDATDDNGVVQIDDDSDYNVDGDDPDMIADTDNDDIDGDGQNGGDEDESDFEDGSDRDLRPCATEATGPRPVGHGQPRRRGDLQPGDHQPGHDHGG